MRRGRAYRIRGRQDEFGNVWYFGEDVKNYEDGKFVDRDGSWIAGVDGAEPGYIMLAAPTVGDEYNQENAPGTAEDHAEVISLTADPNAVPYGDFSSAWQIRETTPLEPGVSESKYYVAGVGQVWGVNETDLTQEVLVKIIIDGTSRTTHCWADSETTRSTVSTARTSSPAMTATIRSSVGARATA